MIFFTFQEALEAWREQGGVLNYHPQLLPSWQELWEVCDTETAEFYTRGTHGTRRKTPRELTEHALAMGGLTPEEIEREMADWVDDPADDPARVATTYKEILREAFEHCQVLTLDHAVPVWFSDGAGESERCESLDEVEALAALGDYGGPAEDYRIVYDYSSREFYSRYPDQCNCMIEALRDGEWVTVFEVSNRIE